GGVDDAYVGIVVRPDALGMTLDNCIELAIETLKVNPRIFDSYDPANIGKILLLFQIQKEAMMQICDRKYYEVYRDKKTRRHCQEHSEAICKRFHHIITYSKEKSCIFARQIRNIFLS
ncbi:MAG: hypothetical protein LBE13_07100, partial [Bacteroidales bacterium]|nr:hypothetical protein [Bacteroidales bacterium]